MLSKRGGWGDIPGRWAPRYGQDGRTGPKVIEPTPSARSESVTAERARRFRLLTLRRAKSDTIRTLWFVRPYQVRARCQASRKKRPTIMYTPIRRSGTPTIHRTLLDFPARTTHSTAKPVQKSENAMAKPSAERR